MVVYVVSDYSDDHFLDMHVDGEDDVVDVNCSKNVLSLSHEKKDNQVCEVN
jgi:hypothetical protein